MKNALIIIFLFQTMFGIAQSNEPTLLSSQFIHNQRFYLELKSTNDQNLLGYCDSGGGLSFLMPDAVAKYNLQSKVKKGFVGHIMKMRYLNFEDVVIDKKIPPPSPTTNFVLRKNFKTISSSILIIMPNNQETKSINKVMPIDVFFGQNFFMKHAWTIDYVNQKVWVNTPLTSTSSNRKIKIGFKKSFDGSIKLGHPSMYMIIDGDTIDVLFDTGASIILSDSGKKMFNTSELTIGGSFIANSVAIKWHAKHPEWKIYPGADKGNDIIEVPQVTICGKSVGPVLFALRKDEVWSQGMINTMDKVVKGAIGGSALQYGKVTIDYNNEWLLFE